MKLNDVLALLNAGYTKAEIEQMEAGNEPIQSTPEPQPEPAEPEPQPEPVQSDPEQTQPSDDYKRLEAKLNQFIGIVQNSNLNQGVDNIPRRTAQDALAEVIAPPRKDKR